MNPLVQALVIAAIQYGPEFVTKLIAILRNPSATVDDVEKLFANVKPYASYGIPDVAPVVAST